MGFVNLVLITRLLSVGDMGRYSLFLMVANLGVQLGLDWSDISVVRHGREEYVRWGRINRSFWARMYLFVPMLVVFTVGYVVFARPITAYVGIPERSIVYVVAFFVLSGLVNALTQAFRSVDQMKRSAYIGLIQKLAFLVVLLPFALAFLPSELPLVLVGVNLSFLVALLVFAPRFDFRLVMPYSFTRGQFRKIWSFSWPQLAGFSGLYVINYVDLYFIRRFLTVEDVGVYNVAYSGFSMVMTTLMFANVIYMPILVEYRASGRLERVRAYLRRIPAFSAAWGLLIVAGVLLSGHVIPLFFSAKYAASVPAFNILLVTTAFYFASTHLLPVINAFDLVAPHQAINIVKSVVNIVADYILVPRLGIRGAAYGTMLAYATGLTLSAALVWWKRGVLTGEGNVRRR